MDPSPEMLGQARALGGKTSNIRFVSGSSYDLWPDFGHFHLVVMGRSFHWMDRVDTLKRLDRIVEPAGAVALSRTPHLRSRQMAGGRSGKTSARTNPISRPIKAPIGIATRRSCSTSLLE